jgi:excisionase family DNA binding protein
MADPLPAVLTRREVAAMFRCDQATVARWVKKGLLPSFTTPGGNHRFHRADVERLIRDSATGTDTDP